MKNLFCFKAINLLFHLISLNIRILCYRLSKDLSIPETKAEKNFTHRVFSFDSTAQKMKCSIKEFFSKCDQIPRKLRIWSHLLKKSLTGNFIFLVQCSFNNDKLKNNLSKEELKALYNLRKQKH